jgi:uncharacterized FAD-dependent dehydrogenase
VGKRHESTSDAAKVHAASSIASLQHVHNGTHKTVRVFHQLAIASKIQSLEQQTEASLNKDLIAIEAERDTQFSLVEKLDNLDYVLAGIANGNDSRRTLVAKVSNNNWAVDERPNVVVCQRLGYISVLCVITW